MTDAHDLPLDEYVEHIRKSPKRKIRCADCGLFEKDCLCEELKPILARIPTWESLP